MESLQSVTETKVTGAINKSTAGGKPDFSLFSGWTMVGIVSLIILIHLGFYHSYIKFFPKFESGKLGPFGPVEFNWIMHLHGVAMMGWVLMLFVQPILIRVGRKDLHRKIGKLSYILAPLVVVSIYIANQDAYHRTLSTVGEQPAVAFLSLTFPGLIFFAVLYGLAMIYRKQARLHMRFMISTAFLFIPPALDRALIYFFQLPGYDVGSNIQLAIIGSVVILDSVKTKKLSPFMLVFCFEVLHKILWHSRDTEFWHAIGGAIAKLL
jgi:hypothetical protein